jgi:hypothetical protein
MTEQEWLTTNDIHRMVVYASGLAISIRKIRLWCCAVLRHRRRDSLVPSGVGDIDKAELLADEPLFSVGLEAAREAMFRTVSMTEYGATFRWRWWSMRCLEEHQSVAQEWAKARLLATAMSWSTRPIATPHSGSHPDQGLVTALRDIFGNPFRPVSLDAPPCKRCKGKGDVPAGPGGAWPGRPSRLPCRRCGGSGQGMPQWAEGREVQRLAQSAYAERLDDRGVLDPARLGVLSDAVEEAGCNTTAILEHLRSPGPHYRGMWSLDLVLGKT